MNRLLPLSLVLLPLSLSALSGNAARLVADVVPECTTCVYTNNAGASSSFPSKVDPNVGNPAAPYLNNICDIDITSSPSGTNNIKLMCRNTVWGVDSTEAPFSFVKPATVPAPVNTRLR